MLILIVLGFALGLFANRYILSADTIPPSPLKPNTSVYQASPPSQGRINMTIPVDLTVVEGGAHLILPSKQAEDIKVDQPVLLYDKDDKLLPIIGKVTFVEQGKGPAANSTGIRIRIDDGPDAPASTVVRGEIIYHSEKYAPRLPLSALVHHNDESAHIWSVVSDGDGGNYARLKTLSSPPLTFGEFFVMQGGEYASDVYILNPDDKLQDNQPVTITRILYEPPGVPNADTIEGRRVGWVFKPKEKVDNSGCGAPAACGGGNGITNFIDKIKAMAADEAKKAKSAP